MNSGAVRYGTETHLGIFQWLNDAEQRRGAEHHASARRWQTGAVAFTAD
jgi:hypothetical protein